MAEEPKQKPLEYRTEKWNPLLGTIDAKTRSRIATLRPVGRMANEPGGRPSALAYGAAPGSFSICSDNSVGMSCLTSASGSSHHSLRSSVAMRSSFIR